MSKAQEVLDLKYAIAEQFLVALAEEDVEKQRRNRSRGQKLALLGRRAFGFVLYLCLQIGGGYGIVMLTLYGRDWLKEVKLESFASSIVPAVVSLINTALPVIILTITKIEKVSDPRFGRARLIRRSGTTEGRTSSGR